MNINTKCSYLGDCRTWKTLSGRNIRVKDRKKPGLFFQEDCWRCFVNSNGENWLLKEFGGRNRKQELRNTLTYNVVYVMYMIYNSNCTLSSSFLPIFLPFRCSAREASRGIAHGKQELYHWITFAASDLSIWDRV